MYNSTPAISLDLREASKEEEKEEEGGGRILYTRELDARHISHENRERQTDRQTETLGETNQQTDGTARTDTAPV